MKVLFEETLPSVESLYSLFITTGWNEEYCLLPEELHRAASASYCTISAWQNGRLAGFGRVVSDGVLHGMIYDLIVHPDFQNRGIGSKILTLLLERCSKDRIKEVQLFCAEGKEVFYNRRGFLRRPETAPGMTFSGKAQ